MDDKERIWLWGMVKDRAGFHRIVRVTMTVGEIKQRATVSGSDSPTMLLDQIPVEMADALNGHAPPEQRPAEEAFREPDPPFEPGLDIGRVRLAQQQAPFGAEMKESDLVELESAFAGAREDATLVPFWEEARDRFLAKYPAAARWLTSAEAGRINEWLAKRAQARREGRVLT